MKIKFNTIHCDIKKIKENHHFEKNIASYLLNFTLSNLIEDYSRFI